MSSRHPWFTSILLLATVSAFLPLSTCVHADDEVGRLGRTHVSIQDGHWHINGHVTNPGAAAEGLLLNTRMVNAVFEDTSNADFDADTNTDELIAKLPAYARSGLNAITLGLQGGFPGYEGAVNSAFAADGSLRATYLGRVQRVLTACDRLGMVVILGCYYQRQDQILTDEAAVSVGVENVAKWLATIGASNVVLEVANEAGHGGFDHASLKSSAGQVRLIERARAVNPGLLVSTSSLGDGRSSDDVAKACDFLLIHFNGTPISEFAARIERLQPYGKPIVCNEDTKVGEAGAAAARRCAELHVSWGLMEEQINQHAPFMFGGPADDPPVYIELARLAGLPPTDCYFPPPESQGGWRRLASDDDISRLGQMDPQRLRELEQWLLESDNRDFAAVVIRNGYVVLQVERNNSATTDSRRLASVSKAICATVLSIASEQSQQGNFARRMSFTDHAFDFIPWAQPLSDPRKSSITIRQLLNHTSGICPEAVGAANDGSWEYVLGLSGDRRTQQLAFDPGTACGYSTHALCHASLVCENVTGKPYDQFAIDELFKPIGCEHWWFQYYSGGERIGRHPSHGMGMPARDLARVAYCMLQQGRWEDRQIIPRWFVQETSQPTHDVTTPEMRWGFTPRVFSHGWELPANFGDSSGNRSGSGIPSDARSKPGSGGQLAAFVPSLNLVITRQTGSSGDWQFEEYLRRACAAAIKSPD